MNKQKGITLIALIITIVVMSILVAISVNVTIGENGIIQTEEQAVQLQSEKSIIENIRLDIIARKAENKGSIYQGEMEEILDKYGTINKNGDTIESLTIDDKGYEIPYEAIYDGIINNVTVGEIVTEKNKTYTKNGTAVIPVGLL